MTPTVDEKCAHAAPRCAAKSMRWRRVRQAAAMSALLSLGLPIAPAHAYLDPGTGSMLVSAVIGVAAAVGLAVKMFWYRLVGLFRGRRSGAVEGAPPADK